MQTERTAAGSTRLTALAQAGLAALVAGTLLTFSTIAFNTAFDEPSQNRGVTVSSPHTTASGPLVLPSPADGKNPATSDVTPAVAIAETDDTVLGARVDSSKPGSPKKADAKDAPGHRNRAFLVDCVSKARHNKSSKGKGLAKGHTKARCERHAKKSHGHKKAASGGRQNNHSHKSDERAGHQPRKASHSAHKATRHSTKQRHRGRGKNKR